MRVSIAILVCFGFFFHEVTVEVVVMIRRLLFGDCVWWCFSCDKSEILLLGES